MLQFSTLSQWNKTTVDKQDYFVLQNNMENKKWNEPLCLKSLDNFEKGKDEKNMTECYICQVKISNKKSSKAHISSVHESKKTFKCPICEYNCSGKRTLTKHISSVHEGKKPFKCSICDYRCAQKRTLIKHVTKVHEITTPFQHN